MNIYKFIYFVGIVCEREKGQELLFLCRGLVVVSDVQGSCSRAADLVRC
jgi:hypothetical protein